MKRAMPSLYESAVKMASYFCGSREAWNALLKFCFFSARDLVDARFREIEWVSDELIQKQRLNYKSVVELINQNIRGGSEAGVRAKEPAQKSSHVIPMSSDAGTRQHSITSR
jgi:hypothetical protein